MIKSKFFRLTVYVLCVISCVLSFTVCVDAAEQARYTNPDTNYQIVIIDDLDLLTDEEEQKLVEDMKPVTAYGNAAFWTTEAYTYNEIDQARLKRKELFNFDSACIFVINMDIRKLTIQSYGTINESLTDSFARSITDNVKGYATSEDYYTCCKTAFSQIFMVCENLHISEPLKISGYIVISLMSGLILAIAIAFSRVNNPLLKAGLYTINEPYQIEGGFKTPIDAVYVSETTVYRPPVSSSSSGSGCSSCSSGSSCSSCGGGGGCGSGGSSSF